MSNYFNNYTLVTHFLGSRSRHEDDDSRGSHITLFRVFFFFFFFLYTAERQRKLVSSRSSQKSLRCRVPDGRSCTPEKVYGAATKTFPTRWKEGNECIFLLRALNGNSVELKIKFQNQICNLLIASGTLYFPQNTRTVFRFKGNFHRASAKFKLTSYRCVYRAELSIFFFF
ncbi:hypothetical protein PUN28_001169 [Cardiocondyla obscurior]|uniref:CUB domain-containing protein n=1 Tax=Cardiocondyla obscurior TaxID=286306 RepID=A0AAW2H3K7_9HYME